MAPSSVLSWVEAGCPRNADKTFDESAVDAWLAKHRESAAESKSLKEQKLQAEITRIQRDIRQRDHDYEASRGEVHSKVDCCKSLTAITSEALQPLLSVGGRLAAQFPELGQRLRDAADKEIDAAMQQIREGLAK